MTSRAKLIAGAVVLLAVVAGLISLTYFGGKKGEDPKRVRMGTLQTAIDYGPYIIAKKKGWIEEALKGEGVTVEYLPTFQAPPAVTEAFSTDRLDLVLTAEVPTVIGRAAGADVQFAWLSATLSSEVIVPTASKANSLADLKGKKVAVLGGSGPHFWLVRNLERSGIPRKEVSAVDMLPPDAKAAFESGVVDAWAMFPPWPEQELVAGKARVLSAPKAPIQVVVAVRGRYAAQHPQTVSAILGALERGRDWLREHPAEAQQIESEELGLPLEVVKLAWPKMDWNARLNDEVIKDIQSKADFLKEEGFVKNSVDVSKDMIWKAPPKP